MTVICKDCILEIVKEYIRKKIGIKKCTIDINCVKKGGGEICKDFNSCLR
jgi:hypothetical protein